MSSIPAQPAKRPLRAAPFVVLGLALASGTWAVVSQRDEISDAVGQLEWWAVPGSALSGAAGLFAIFLAWLVIVRDGGIPLTGRQALRIYGVGQVGKYVPGSVWSVLAQAELVREYGGSRVRMAASSLVALLISVTVALAMGGLMLPASDDEAWQRFWFAPILAAALMVFLIPSVLNGAVARVNRLLRRPPDDARYSAKAIATSAGWAVIANLLFGVHLQALGGSLGVSGLEGYLLCTCAYALAAGLGVLIVLAPAGVGVRETVIVVVLAPALTVGAALTVALLSRAISIVVDLGLALTQARARGTRDVSDRPPVFITRRFPPSIGGMETLALGTWRSLSSVRPDAILIAHRGSNKRLVIWVPLAVLRLCWLVLRRRVGLVVTGDAAMHAVVAPVLRLGGIPSATMILGLDVTYPNPLYRLFVTRSLLRAQQVVAISAATRDAAVAVGVRADRIDVLRLGVRLPELPDASVKAAARARTSAQLGLAQDDVLLLTLGRLVRRKGVRWFIDNVMPELPESVHYVVAGDGPDRDEIEAAAGRAGLSGRVHLLGRVDDATQEDLLTGCDIFVQPNIAVPGDMEGFGLVTVEAAMRGTLVLAADLEGLRDAVIPGRSGELLASEDALAWITAVTALLEDRGRLAAHGESYAQVARREYSEEAMGVALCRLIGLTTRSPV